MAISIKVQVGSVSPAAETIGMTNMGGGVPTTNPENHPLVANLRLVSSNGQSAPGTFNLPLPIAESDLINFVPGTYKYLVVSDTDPNPQPNS